MVENGIKFLIYSDLFFYKICNEIVFDLIYMLDVFVSVIIIEGLNIGERILIFCEVYVYGKYVVLIIFF